MEKEKFKEFLHFNKMLTPLMIQIIFWICVVVSVLGGLGQIVNGLGNSYFGGMQVIGGLIMLVVGPLFARIWCEFILVIFKIYESLKNVEKKLNENKEQQ